MTTSKDIYQKKKGWSTPLPPYGGKLHPYLQRLIVSHTNCLYYADAIAVQMPYAETNEGIAKAGCIPVVPTNRQHPLPVVVISQRGDTARHNQCM